MPINTKRTLREKLLVEAWIKGFENSNTGLIGAILTLFFGGILGLWYSFFGAMILGVSLYYSLNKAYKAYKLLAVEINEIYLLPFSDVMLSDADWVVYQANQQKEAN